MKEHDVLDKALTLLDDALTGRIVDPSAVDVAVRMTQFFWSSVYIERLREKQIAESLRHRWDDTITDQKK